jgi:CheY-like chemotaxis protein
VEILLADDDRDVRDMLAFALRDAGYSITEASSGDDLLERLWTRAESQAGFDLIISDVRMPGASAIEVLEVIRDLCDPGDPYQPQVRETPIIFITAFGDPEVHRAAARLGAVVFDKPFDIADVRAAALGLVAPEDELDALYHEDGDGD